MILIVTAAASANVLADARNELQSLGLTSSLVQFYPAAVPSVDLLSSVPDPQVLTASVSAAPVSPDHPYSVLVVVQATGSHNVRTVRRLLEGGGGVKLQALAEMLVRDGDRDMVRTVGLSIPLSGLSISSLTR